ncbi:MAG: endonuclease VII domain-containing protein [Nitrospira sp.]|nr:endonuclease VII domain-containing protein [Nitrospira sp.]
MLTKEEKTLRRRASSKKWKNKNRLKAKENAKQWRDEKLRQNPLYDRAKALRLKYNMSLAEYDSMLEGQGGVCAICGTDTPGGMGRFPVDHNPETNKIRGILCNSCNLGIGHFKHDSNLTKLATEYLLRNN